MTTTSSSSFPRWKPWKFIARKGDFWAMSINRFEKERTIIAAVGLGQVVVLECTEEGIVVERANFTFFKHSHAKSTQPRERELLYTCAWSINVDTGEPILAVAGELGLIYILNVRRRKIQTVLRGHGQYISEIVFVPTDPTLLLSCSKDKTIRLWTLENLQSSQWTTNDVVSLRREDGDGTVKRKQADKEDQSRLVAIFAGVGGHQWTVLTLSAHESGAYFASSGMDRSVKVWSLNTPAVLRAIEGRKSQLRNGAPRPSTQPAPPNSIATSTNVSKPIYPPIINFPVFATTALHGHWVDSLVWYGDFIISKNVGSVDDEGGEECISIWKPDLAAVKTSGSGGIAVKPHELHKLSRLELLQTLSLPGNEDVYWLRLAVGGPVHRYLAAGNAHGSVFVWDLESPTNLETPTELDCYATVISGAPGRPGAHAAGSATRGRRAKGKTSSTTNRQKREGNLKSTPLDVREVGISNCGSYVVAACRYGAGGGLCIFRRNV